MSNGPLHKYTSKAEAASGPQADERGDVADLIAFGWLRGLDARAVMLDLRKRNGNRLAVAYSWISQIAFDPSKGIVLHAGTLRVSIAGSNLAADQQPGVNLYEGMLRHRVLWIREGSSEEAFGRKDLPCYIDGINW